MTVTVKRAPSPSQRSKKRSLRIDLEHDMKDKLSRVARVEGRTVSGLVRFVLQRYLNDV